MEKDIAGAILAEEQYLYDKSHNEIRGLSIYDYLLPYGYENLSEFRKDKLFKSVKELNLDIVPISSEQIEEKGGALIYQYFIQNKPYFLYNIHLNNDIIFLPLSSENRYDGFTVLKPGYNCEPNKGNIMTFDNDLDIVILLPKEFSLFFKYMKEEIIKFLSECTDKEIISDGNDILINGEKISGSASFENNDYIAIMYHVSFANKTDIIRNAFPNSEKKAGHIDFITAENLLEHILSWLP